MDLDESPYACKEKYRIMVNYILHNSKITPQTEHFTSPPPSSIITRVHNLIRFEFDRSLNACFVSSLICFALCVVTAYTCRHTPHTPHKTHIIVIRSIHNTRFLCSFLVYRNASPKRRQLINHHQQNNNRHPTKKKNSYKQNQPPPPQSALYIWNNQRARERVRYKTTPHKMHTTPSQEMHTFYMCTYDFLHGLNYKIYHAKNNKNNNTMTIWGAPSAISHRCCIRKTPLLTQKSPAYYHMLFYVTVNVFSRVLRAAIR